MSYSKEIVCLANSHKFGEHCVAGKEIDGDEFKEWIRPVNSPGGGALSDGDMCCEDGKPPELLDVIHISLKKHQGKGHQTENYSIDAKKRWKRVGKIAFVRVEELADTAKALWVNGFNSDYGENDRVPEDKAKKLKSSLLLIKPSKLLFRHQYEFGAKKWRTRAVFRYRNVDYCLAVTDPNIEARYYMKDAGDYPINSKNIYLTVSLGQAYKEYCYKLVAGVILPPKRRAP